MPAWASMASSRRGRRPPLGHESHPRPDHGGRQGHAPPVVPAESAAPIGGTAAGGTPSADRRGLEPPAHPGGGGASGRPGEVEAEPPGRRVRRAGSATGNRTRRAGRPGLVVRQTRQPSDPVGRRAIDFRRDPAENDRGARPNPRRPHAAFDPAGRSHRLWPGDPGGGREGSGNRRTERGRSFRAASQGGQHRALLLSNSGPVRSDRPIDRRQSPEGVLPHRLRGPLEPPGKAVEAVVCDDWLEVMGVNSPTDLARMEKVLRERRSGIRETRGPAAIDPESV